MFKKLKSWLFKRSSAFAFGALVISSLFNIIAIRHLASNRSVDDSHFSYIEDDHPTELPLRLKNVALTFENSDDFTVSDVRSWWNWKSLDHTLKGQGFVSLGPDGRIFGISMFHQFHCLEMLRQALIHGVDAHSHHCINYLRQSILCSADTTLDPINFIDPNGTKTGTDGTGTTHVCKDWTQVYDFVMENENKPGSPWLGGDTIEDHHHGDAAR